MCVTWMGKQQYRQFTQVKKYLGIISTETINLTILAVIIKNNKNHWLTIKNHPLHRKIREFSRRTVIHMLALQDIVVLVIHLSFLHAKQISIQIRVNHSALFIFNYIYFYSIIICICTITFADYIHMF